MGRDASRRARGTPLTQLELPLPAPRVHQTVAGESMRAVQLGKRTVTYRFRRASRRTIGISVGRQGLVAAAPRWVSIDEVEAFIREKEQWVLAKLVEAATLVRARMEWSHGAMLPLLGRDISLHLTAATENVRVDDGCLLVPGAHDSSDAMRAAVVGWMKRFAIVLFRERAEIFATRLELAAPNVRISNAMTQWGHCTVDRAGRAHVYLHWRLLHFPERLIDYVVVHELAHIREMNHSPRFWRIVGAVCPDYQAMRKEIHAISRRLPEL
jgi:predicted metal-dependent hydrolase